MTRTAPPTIEPRARAHERALSALLSIALLGALFALAPVSTVQATDGTVKDMTFFLHWVNDTETSKTIHDYSVRNYFDTTLEFNDENFSVTSDTSFDVEWWLVPALAGDFRASELTLSMWMNASGGTKSSQVTVGLYDVEDASNNSDGEFVAEENFGSTPLQTLPTLEVFSFSFASYTFAAGHSLRVVMSLVPGTNTQVTLLWDTPTVNSRVSFQGPDSVDVEAIALLDPDGNVTQNLDPGATDKTATFRANVTDPLGGYDLVWVNLTLTSPFDTVVLDNVSMLQVAGTPLSFESVFEFEWNYSGQPQGQWSVEVWALDNNGHHHYFFFQQFTFGPYPDTGTATFSIGGLPLFANVLAVDGGGTPLVGATVTLLSGGFPVVVNRTDAAGLTNLSLLEDTYEVQVHWQEVLVASQTESIQENVTEEDPLVVTARVFSPAFQTVTADGSPLPGASLLLGHPNGTLLEPARADAAGRIVLEQMAGGNYSLEVSWRGIPVFSGVREVASDGPLTVPTQVFELTVTVTSGEGPLPGAFVSVADETGLVFDANVTDESGQAVLLLPQGTYTVRVRYVTTHLGTLYDSGPRTASVELTDSQSVSVGLEDFPPPLTTTRFFLLGLVYIGTVVALVAALLLVRRRQGGTPPWEE